MFSNDENNAMRFSRRCSVEGLARRSLLPPNPTRRGLPAPIPTRRGLLAPTLWLVVLSLCLLGHLAQCTALVQPPYNMQKPPYMQRPHYIERIELVGGGNMEASVVKNSQLNAELQQLPVSWYSFFLIFFNSIS